MIDGETQLTILQLEVERNLKELKRAIEHPKIKKDKHLLNTAKEWYDEFSDLNIMLLDYVHAKDRRWLKRKLKRGKIILKITNKVRALKGKRDPETEKKINKIIGVVN
ncbi:hypothetical protein AYK24_08380 [Thermoplasmatales archaeon SG8-52-4]|nr:MAG: hypothetical protein AYK24_08380 [Thermoplasmatales archaeon SG8-52-4]